MGRRVSLAGCLFRVGAPLVAAWILAASLRAMWTNGDYLAAVLLGLAGLVGLVLVVVLWRVTRPATCPHCGARADSRYRICGVCGQPRYPDAPQSS